VRAIRVSDAADALCARARVRDDRAGDDLARCDAFHEPLSARDDLSNPDFENSLTVDGAASSHYALQVMSAVALIFVPLVLLYQGWTYYIFRTGSAMSPWSLRRDAY